MTVEHSAPVCTPDAPCDACLARPVENLSHITWITLEGDEVDEFIPWKTQAAPGFLSFRGGRDWVVESVIDVVPTRQMPPKPGAVTVRFIVCKEITVTPTAYNR